jgi:ABC-type antimicrobial peptide transport system permease subunit
VRYHWNAVSPEYFDAMNIPVLMGRTFSERQAGSARPVIVNKTFADRYLRGRHAAGVMFRRSENAMLYQIVGVVADTKNLTIGEEDKPQFYESLSQIDNDRPRIQFVLRSAIAPAAQLGAVRQALRAIDAAAAVEVQTLYSSIGLAFLPSQIGAALMGSMGALGLLLAAIGLYGVLAYSVSRQMRDIGIRIAIGAGRRAISRMVLVDSAKLLAAGLLPGLCVALFVTPPLAMFLVAGLSPRDPASFALVVGALLVTAAAAVLGPLRRALTVDPARCLRYE